MTRYEYRNMNLGGISDSRYQGSQSSSYRMLGWDVHSEPGIMKTQQALDRDIAVSGSAVAIVNDTDGNVFYFMDNGDVWRRDSGGDYFQEVDADNNPGGAPAGSTKNIGRFYSADILGNYIYFTALLTGSGADTWANNNDVHLGRYNISSSTFNFDLQVLTNQNDNAFYPIMAIEDKIYIGEPKDSASGTSSFITYYSGITNPYHDTIEEGALDIPGNLTPQVLGDYYGEMAIGAAQYDLTNEEFRDFSEIFVWDRVSLSWYSRQKIPEYGVFDMFIHRNIFLIAAGLKGNIYSFNGQQASLYRRIPGIYTSNAQAYCNGHQYDPNSNVTLLGYTRYQTKTNPLDLEDGVGEDYESGVYALGGYSSGYPDVIIPHYIIDTTYKTVDLAKIGRQGDTLLFAYKDGFHSVDDENKFNAPVWTSRIFNQRKEILKTVRVWVYYRLIGAGVGLTVKISKNDGPFVEMPEKQQAKQKVYETQYHVGGCASYQIQVVSQSADNLGIEIEAIVIDDGL